MTSLFLFIVYIVVFLVLLCVAGLISEYFMVRSEKSRSIVVGAILKPRG
jgi:hypothetical protein